LVRFAAHRRSGRRAAALTDETYHNDAQ
jgi:hypothetical protein